VLAAGGCYATQMQDTTRRTPNTGHQVQGTNARHLDGASTTVLYRTGQLSAAPEPACRAYACICSTNRSTVALNQPPIPCHHS
jgi:hypothetical protein